jgi:hypothetical protein
MAPPAEAERAHFATQQTAEGWRLALQSTITAATQVFIPALSQIKGQIANRYFALGIRLPAL